MPDFRFPPALSIEPSARRHSAEQVTPPTIFVPSSPPHTGRESLTDAQVFSLIRVGQPLKIKKCVITGDIDLSRMHIPEALEFDDCIFEGHFNAQSTRFDKTLTLNACFFKRSLTLRDAQIGGALNVKGSVVDLPGEVHKAILGDPVLKNRNSHLYEAPPDHRAAKWDGMTVMGSMYAERLTVRGSLNLGDTEIRGSLHLDGCRIGNIDKVTESGKFSGLDFGRLYMRQIRVDGDVEMSVSVDEKSFTEAEINGDLDISGGEKAYDQSAPRRCHIYSSLSIGSSVIHGRLNLRGAQIDGALHAIMAHVTGRVLADCWVHPDEPKTTRQTFIGVARPSPATATSPDETVDDDLSGWLSLYFQDTKIGSSIWLRGAWTSGGADFENADIGGSLDLRCWHDRKNEVTGTTWDKLTEQKAFSDRIRETSSNGAKPENIEHIKDDILYYQTRIGSSGKKLGFRSGWQHVELGAVEQDADAKVSEVREPPCIGFDVLDQRIEAFAHRVGNPVRQVV